VWLYQNKPQNIVLNLVELVCQVCHFVCVNPQFFVDLFERQIQMAPYTPQADVILDDPIELVTRFVVTHEWLFQRRSENAVLVEVPGKWCDYQLAVVWKHDESAMQVTCRIDVQSNTAQYGEMALLAALLNKQIFIGHLALDVTTGELELRYTLALRGAGGATPEQIEDVVDIMLGECEHCYPAIYQVAIHSVLATAAAAATMFATEGEA
jgi:hypothetical protein